MNSPTFTASATAQASTAATAAARRRANRSARHLSLVVGSGAEAPASVSRRISPDHPAAMFLAERATAPAVTPPTSTGDHQTEPESSSRGTSSRGRGHHDNRGPVHSGSGPQTD